MKDVRVLSSGMLGVSFSASSSNFSQLVEEVKSLPDRKWVPKGLYWEIPNTKFSRDKLESLGFDVPLPAIKKVFEKDIHPKLYDFQRLAVKKIGALNGRCLLAMEMGLGKSAVSLTYASIFKEERPVIIVVPASVKLNWIKEIHKWTEGETPIVVNGRDTFYCKGFSMVIINYAILADHVDYLISLNPKMLIVDEVQMVKNTGSQRTKGVKKLARAVDNMMALSGTPILNKPAEFWSILNMLRPDAWKRKMPFQYRYCDPTNNGFAMVFNGATNTEELNTILNEEVMYRALKKDVLTQLPDKVFSVVPFEIDKRKYRMAEMKLTQFLQQNNSPAEALIRFGEMRMVAVEEKMPMVVKWIQDFIDTDGKLVVFGIHHKVVDLLMKEFAGKAVKLDGRDNQDKRDVAIRRFQDDDSIRLFIGNVEAAGVGIDGLQNAASSVAFVELPWVPAMIDQASDRLHRIGQKDSVNVYFLIADETVEQYIAEAIDRKRAVLDSVLDGKDTSEGSMIVELMAKYKGGVK